MVNGKITIDVFKKKKTNGEKIIILTSYDSVMTRVIESAGVDVILVGDSVGMVLMGYDSTLPVKMDEMLMYAGAVARSSKHAFLIGDMPFMSYQVSNELAVHNAGRFIKEAGCEAVKIEGGKDVISRIKVIINAGIPVMGHIGLTPQNIHKIGGYKVQGKDDESIASLEEDALLLESCGCFAIIIECVPSTTAEKITKKLGIPTIGIGAGPYCDGQVLVTHDLLGYSEKNPPKFVKKYANLNQIMLESVTKFKHDVENGIFPNENFSY